MVIAMDKVKYNVIMAGLLHDTGKLILRSEPQRKNHSQAGAEFLARYISDTPEILQRRVMEEAEWKLLPEAVCLFCEGRLRVEGRTVIIEQE